MDGIEQLRVVQFVRSFKMDAATAAGHARYHSLIMDLAISLDLLRTGRSLASLTRTERLNYDEQKARLDEVRRQRDEFLQADFRRRNVQS